MSYFEEQLNSDQSLRDLKQLIDSIFGWMEKNKYHTDNTIGRFTRLRETLDDKSRNVLFLAEFSRGKTELVNSTIFGDLGIRLLPSAPGRTTRCTTMLHYSKAELPSIKLLPTRASSDVQQQPLDMLLEDDSVWEHTLFAVSDKESVREALKQIAETELVTPEEAMKLGFLHDTSHEGLVDAGVLDGMIPVPKWRHGIINYPHSLLKQGLRIVDTPGLNALGVEPELTIQALDAAHAIVFVLSADTGVTRSELDMWRDHVRDGGTENVIVVLNKIDLLWDELKTQEEIKLDMECQMKEVAQILEIRQDQVYPVSAQKSLVGRARHDQKLTRDSGILQYEQMLADTINLTSHRRVVARVIKELSPALNSIRTVIKRRVTDVEDHIEELKSFHQNQVNATRLSMEKVKGEMKKHTLAERYVADLKEDLAEGYRQFVRRLDLVFLDRMIAKYRYEISNQFTTPGLQRDMNNFHEVSVERFQMALSFVGELEGTIAKTFSEVEKVLGITGIKARKIEPQVYVDSLKKLQSKHTQHSTGIGMVMTEQHILRDRYHAAVMIRIRNLYKQTRDDVDRWCRTVLVPLELEMKERSNEIKRRKISIERINNNDSKVIDEIHLHREQATHFMQRYKTIDHFISRLDECSKTNNAPTTNVVNLQEHMAKAGFASSA